MKMEFKVILVIVAFVAINNVAMAETGLPTTASPSESTSLKPNDATTQSTVIHQINPTKRICASVKFDLQFNLTYKTIDNKNTSVLYNISTDTLDPKSTTSCMESNSSLTMPIGWENTSNMTIHFKGDANELTLSEIHLFINVSEKYKSDAKANQTMNLVYKSETNFTASIGKPLIKSSETLIFSNSSGGAEPSNEKFNVTISNLRFETFTEGSNPSANRMQNDAKAEQSNTVIIACVSSLIVLIVLALIAFVIIWRRGQTRAVWSTLNCTSCK